jgi:Ca-activated chloride channel family protein
VYDNLRFPLREQANEYLPRLWATRRVGWLMEQIRTNGEQKELRDEVVDLGTRYGIVTPYTSYLALENEQSSLNVVPAPANAPMTRRPGRILGGMAAPKAADATATTGAVAVQESKRTGDQQRAYQLKEEASSVIRRAGGKTFYLRDDVWTDAEFKADANLPETALTFGSDEYFALLKQKPALASYFSLGERVIVVFEGKVYRVNAVK